MENNRLASTHAHIHTPVNGLLVSQSALAFFGDGADCGQGEGCVYQYLFCVIVCCLKHDPYKEIMSCNVFIWDGGRGAACFHLITEIMVLINIIDISSGFSYQPYYLLFVCRVCLRHIKQPDSLWGCFRAANSFPLFTPLCIVPGRSVWSIIEMFFRIPMQMFTQWVQLRS